MICLHLDAMLPTDRPDVKSDHNHSVIRIAAGLLFVIAGTIWLLQGFDVSFAPQSFMTGNKWWIVWGATAIFVGAAFIWRSRRR